MTSKMKTLNIIVYSYNNVQYKTNKNVINSFLKVNLPSVSIALSARCRCSRFTSELNPCKTQVDTQKSFLNKALEGKAGLLLRTINNITTLLKKLFISICFHHITCGQSAYTSISEIWFLLSHRTWRLTSISRFVIRWMLLSYRYNFCSCKQFCKPEISYNRQTITECEISFLLMTQVASP